jgi:hypothetical protein
VLYKENRACLRVDCLLYTSTEENILKNILLALTKIYTPLKHFATIY